MVRKVVTYTVPDEGRDKGKVFQITEMDASRGEAWATKALLALMNGNVDVPPGFEKMGMAAMVEMGIRSLTGLKWEVAEPLLAEMLSCVAIIPDPTRPAVFRNLIEDDIEEIATRIKLRAEVWKMHADFLQAVDLSSFKKLPQPVDG